MLRSLTCATVLTSLSSCVFHVHVHEAPREKAIDTTQARMADTQPAESAERTVSASVHRVHGSVVDADGKPVAARIALIGAAGGSYSMTLSEPRDFDLESPFGAAVVIASTLDGRVAVQRLRGGGQDVRLVLALGGSITIDFTSESDMRCAVFHGDLRIEDFTLRAKSDRTQVIVPVGDIRVQVYGGGTSPSGGPGVTYDERVTITQGETSHVKFSVHPNRF